MPELYETSVEKMNDLEIVATYSAFLSSLGLRHAVGGSLASSAWSEQRSTNDADIVVELSQEAVKQFLDRLPEDFHVDETEIRNATQSLNPFESFQSLYMPIAFKIDNFVANSQWSLQQIDRAKFLPLGQNQVPFTTPEDILIAKCRWFELGNRVSDRQWNDLVRLYEVQRENLDRAYIEKWLGEFKLLDLWEEIQRQTKA